MTIKFDYELAYKNLKTAYDKDLDLANRTNQKLIEQNRELQRFNDAKIKANNKLLRENEKLHEKIKNLADINFKRNGRINELNAENENYKNQLSKLVNASINPPIQMNSTDLDEEIQKLKETNNHLHDGIDFFENIIKHLIKE